MAPGFEAHHINTAHIPAVSPFFVFKNKPCFAGMLRQTDKALSTPLPRVFDTDPTTGKPMPSAPAVMGTEQENVEDAVRTGTLNEIADQTSSKMEMEVLAPMEQWLRLFQVCYFSREPQPAFTATAASNRLQPLTFQPRGEAHCSLICMIGYAAPNKQAAKQSWP